MPMRDLYGCPGRRAQGRDKPCPYNRDLGVPVIPVETGIQVGVCLNQDSQDYRIPRICLSYPENPSIRQILILTIAPRLKGSFPTFASSFPWKRESIMAGWIPAFAGMTFLCGRE